MKRLRINWETLMFASFTFAIPLFVLESVRPGLVTAFVPMQVFAIPFFFIIPAAYQKNESL